MENVDGIRLVTRWFNYTLAIPMIILGVVGALLTVAVFTSQRHFWRNTTITYLLAGAVMTGIHLPAIYLQSILVNGFNLGLFNTNDAACREHNYLLYMTTVTAISFPCWAAFDQYVHTCRNARFRYRWSSIRLARIIIVGTVLFWTIVYLPIIFYSGIIDGVCVLLPGPFATFNTYVMTPLVYSIAPILIITIFTLGAVRNLRSVTGHKPRGRLALQVRRMLIPQLVVLIVSGVPFGFEGVYLDLTSHVPKDSFRLALENVFAQAILLLYHCNYVCTFYIYWCMSGKVRRATKRALCRFVRRNAIEPDHTTNDNSITLQTLNGANSASNNVDP